MSLLSLSLVDPDGLDIWVVWHRVDQGHELAVRGELSRLYTVQAPVSSVFLYREISQLRPYYDKLGAPYTFLQL